MSGNFSDWSPNTNYVQAGLKDGAYANAAYAMLAAGPPRLSQIGGAASVASAVEAGNPSGDQLVLPIGLVQQFSLSQNRQFNRIWEIGSERSYFISGRTMGQVSFGRVYYHGASLLRYLYAYYEDLVPPTLVPAMFPNEGIQNVAEPHDVTIPPGYENLYTNLASDLFAQPVGLMWYVRDSNQKTLGAVYLESSVVPNYSFSTDAQGLMIQEQVAMQFERSVPVKLNAAKLVGAEAAG